MSWSSGRHVVWSVLQHWGWSCPPEKLLVLVQGGNEPAELVQILHLICGVTQTYSSIKAQLAKMENTNVTVPRMIF